ncbi:MAG: bifunctional chorismate mutase/prephenate dehydratase, partial [Chloroflexota bacterium]|nr:bifunctional chorismate mutase/prephenate dehydratase [Chloroflexota bacterium]
MPSDYVTVAFQGEHGAYSEAALLAFFGSEATPLPRESFEEAFTAVEEGQADAALLPVDNTLGGSIHRNYDLMLRHSLYIIGEV